MAGYSIYQQDAENMARIRDLAASFVIFYENGGPTCDFTSNIIKEIYKLAYDSKMNRDYCQGIIDYKKYFKYQDTLAKARS